MTSILDFETTASDSEDDEDYVPPTNEGDDDISCGEEGDPEDFCNDESSNNSKKRKRKKCKDKRAEKISEDEEKSKENVILSEEDQKKKSTELWKTFLSDVGPIPSKTKSTFSSNSKTIDTANADKKLSSPDTTAKNSKVTVTEVFEFAGETVTVSKEVDKDKVDADRVQTVPLASTLASDKVAKPSSAIAPKRSGGLSSLVGNITGKKQKLSTLEKSLLDWNTFKKEEGIEEELRTHNMGKSGYLEKQAFLQRSDLRQFEIEKNLRISKRKNT